MRVLVLIAALFALAYGGAWALGARATRAAAEARIETLRDAGWTVETGGLSVSGFPSRLDLWIEAPRVTAPDGTAWSAPFVQSLQLLYQRDRRILALPDSQVLTINGTQFQIASEELRASIRGGRITLEAASLSATWPDHALSAGAVLAALRPATSGGGDHDVYLRATDLTLDGTDHGALTLEAVARLDTPLSPTALPWPDSLEVSRLLPASAEAPLAAIAAELAQRQ